jgi:hypothetical protein
MREVFQESLLQVSFYWLYTYSEISAFGQIHSHNTFNGPTFLRYAKGASRQLWATPVPFIFSNMSALRTKSIF